LVTTARVEKRRPRLADKSNPARLTKGKRKKHQQGNRGRLTKGNGRDEQPPGEVEVQWRVRRWCGAVEREGAGGEGGVLPRSAKQRRRQRAVEHAIR